MSEHITEPQLEEKHVHPVSLEDARADIIASFPNFKIETIEPAGQGFTNIAFLVNSEYIFRFAKRLHASEQIKREIELLPQLEPLVKIPIPHIEYSGTRKENGFYFMGYKKIIGETMGKEVYDQLGEDTQGKFTQGIAGFITDTHSFSVDRALKLGVEYVDYKKKYTKEFEATERLIYPLVDDATRAYLKNLFTSYLNDPSNFTYIPTFNHAEVSPYHIIINRGSQEITGIIDFGDMHVGDPDYDLNYLYNNFGQEYILKLLKYYEHSEPDRLIKKLEFFSSYGELQMIFVGIRENKETLQRGLDMLQKQVEKAATHSQYFLQNRT